MPDTTRSSSTNHVYIPISVLCAYRNGCVLAGVDVLQACHFLLQRLCSEQRGRRRRQQDTGAAEQHMLAKSDGSIAVQKAALAHTSSYNFDGTCQQPTLPLLLFPCNRLVEPPFMQQGQHAIRAEECAVTALNPICEYFVLDYPISEPVTKYNALQQE
jgi:hypothetical protein